jgi:hypothetical protein
MLEHSDLVRPAKPRSKTSTTLLRLPGTDLVVRQQNISRSVTMRQYRSVLEAARDGKIAKVKPAEPGTRAEKGVQGLTRDVAPSLVWGRQNVRLLESRLEELRRNRTIVRRTLQEFRNCFRPCRTCCERHWLDQ